MIKPNNIMPVHSIQLDTEAEEYVLRIARRGACSPEEAICHIINTVARGFRKREDDIIPENRVECLKESKSRIHPCYLPAQWHCVLPPCEVSGRVDFALRLDSGHVQCLSLTRENAEVFVKTFEDCLYGKFTVSFTPEGLPLVSVSKWREEGNVIKPNGDQAAVLSEPESRTHPSYRPARWRCVLKPCEVSGRIAFSFTLDSGQAQRFSLTIGNAEVFVKMLQDCLNGYLSISHSDKSYGISSEEVSTPQESESVAPMFKSPAAPSGSS